MEDLIKTKDKERTIIFDENGNVCLKKYARKISDKTIAKKLIEYKGFVSAVAKDLGVTTRYIKVAIDRSKILQDILETIDDTLIDLSETKLFDLIKEGNFEAIKFYLKSKGKERGYSDTLNIGGSDGKSLSINITPILPEKPEEQKSITLSKGDVKCLDKDKNQ